MSWTTGVQFLILALIEFFLFTTTYILSLRLSQLPIQWVLGALTPGVKWPGHEADDSPPSCAEVKNTWSCTTISQYVFVAWCLVKHRQFYLIAAAAAADAATAASSSSSSS
jgi:hypothetical protein